MLKHILALSLLLLPATALAQMPHQGFVFEGRMAGAYAVSGASAGPVAAVPSIFAGVRLLGRLQAGMGFSFFRLAAPGAAGAMETDSNLFAFVPEVAIDILKSSDQQVAWYGKLGLPMGAAVTSVSTGPLSASDSSFVIGYDAALGVRYSPHPMFAIGMEGGLFGMFVSPTKAGGFGLTSVYGALVGTFYWGH